MPAKGSAKTTLRAESKPSAGGSGDAAVGGVAGVSVKARDETSAEVAWSGAGGAQEFSVGWSVAGQGAWAEEVVPASVRSHVVSGLRSGTRYDFRVQARSAWSDVAQARTAGSAVPAPSLTVSGVLDRHAVVSVGGVQGPAVAQVQVRDTRADSPWWDLWDVPWNVPAPVLGQTSFGLRGLSTGTAYAVRARVTVAGETSGWGPELRFVTTGTGTAKPLLRVVEKTGGSVRLAWSAPMSGLVSVYRWVRAVSGSPFRSVRVGHFAGQAGVAEDSGLVLGGDYWYTVEWLRDARTVSVSGPVAVGVRG